MSESNFIINLHVHRMFICRYTDLNDNMLQTFDNEDPFNIYMIFKGNKILLDKNNSYISDDENLILNYNVHNKGEVDTKEFKLNINKKLKFDKLKLNIEYPHRLFTVTQEDKLIAGGIIDNVIRNIRRQLIESKPFAEQNESDEFEHLNVELLYVGQSQGKIREKTALQRLVNHATFQNILARESYNDPDCDILIGLIQFEILPLFMMIPESMRNHQEKGNPNPAETMMNLLQPEKYRNEAINLIEAGLIKYFSPKYNKNFKDHFPSKFHTSYKFFYENNIHSLAIEFFPGILIGSRISTEKRKNFTLGIIKYLIEGSSGDLGAFKFDIDE